MKNSNLALLSLAAAFVIIGTHQTITVGLIASYPIFMLAVVFLFWYKYRKNQQVEGQENSKVEKPKNKGKK
jgi:uncharacterized membrane protein